MGSHPRQAALLAHFVTPGSMQASRDHAMNAIPESTRRDLAVRNARYAAKGSLLHRMVAVHVKHALVEGSQASVARLSAGSARVGMQASDLAEASAHSVPLGSTLNAKA